PCLSSCGFVVDQFLHRESSCVPSPLPRSRSDGRRGPSPPTRPAPGEGAPWRKLGSRPTRLRQLFHVRGGKVTRLVVYWDSERSPTSASLRRGAPRARSAPPQ